MKIILFLLFGICFNYIISCFRNYIKSFYLLHNTKDEQQEIAFKINNKIEELNKSLDEKTDNDIILLKQRSECKFKLFQYNTLYNSRIKSLSNKIVLQSIILLIALINCVLCVLYI